MKLYVCVGSSCHLKGSYEVVNKLRNLIALNNVNAEVGISASFCLGNCSYEGVSVRVDDVLYNILPSEVEDFFNEHILNK